MERDRAVENYHNIVTQMRSVVDKAEWIILKPSQFLKRDVDLKICRDVYSSRGKASVRLTKSRQRVLARQMAMNHSLWNRRVDSENDQVRQWERKKNESKISRKVRLTLTVVSIICTRNICMF